MDSIDKLQKHRLTVDQTLYRRINSHELHLDSFGYYTPKSITKPVSLASKKSQRLPQHMGANAWGGRF